MFVEDEEDENSKQLINLLKAAASVNRDLVFGCVGHKQWADFVETFDVREESKIPQMIVWDGNEEYFSVVGLESMEEEDEKSHISEFLQGYRKGSVIRKQIAVPSSSNHTKSLLIILAVHIVLLIAVVVMIFWRMIKEDNTRSSTSLAESRELHQSGEKED